MRTRKTWTDKEIDILKKYVSRYGRFHGSMKAADKLGRTFESCDSKVAILKRKGFKYKKVSSKGEPDVKVKALRKYVAENPDNLQRAFRLTAVETGLSPATIENYWYGKEGYMSRNTVGNCFITVGSKAVVNGKNCRKEGVTSDTVLGRITSMIKRILGIN